VPPACWFLQVLQTSGLQDPSQVDWRYVLPTIVSNMHDYFIAVAAKLERAHTEVRVRVHHHHQVTPCQPGSLCQSNNNVRVHVF
jgi:hypothetical protein